MKLKKIPGFLLLLIPALILFSCNTDCNCRLQLGCTIMTAKKISDNSLVERQTYCSTSDYFIDRARTDSVNAFSLRHSSDGSGVQGIDSFYYYQNTNKLNTNQVKYYEDLGYTCGCSK